MCFMVRFIKTMTYQCQQLKLSPLSTQIIIYYLMTNQTSSVMLNLQAINFSRPPPLPRAINPDARPLGTFHSQHGCH